MEYEKKYRDLVEAVKELQEANPHDEGIQKWVEDNVPELKESIVDNNKTMLNACINTLRNVGHSHLATWLEKQKPMEDFNGDDYGIDSLWHAIRILEKTLGEVEGYQTDDGILEHKCAITAVRKLAKERREQKPVEEVKGVSHKWYMCIEGVENFSKGCLYTSNIDDQGTEWITDDTGHGFLYGHYSRYFRPATEKEIPYKPEFKVGDWICHKRYKKPLMIIADLGDNSFDAVDWFGNKLHLRHDDMDDHRLWTIQDAKDSDVLATEDWVFIFKKMNSNGKPVCYCHYDIELGFRIDTNSYMASGSEIYPATKEQRDLLFQKMSDACYAFDFVNKEMIKIEDELITGIEIPFGAKDSELEEVFYSIPNGFHAEIEDDKVVIKKGEKKPWSKEDEEMLNNAIRAAKINGQIPTVDWLKTLKSRVQPKQEWSKEDEEIRNNCIYWLEKARKYFEKDEDLIYDKKWIVKCTDWLKSLRPQNRWKPTKRQLESLEMAAKYYMAGKISKNYAGKDLTEILQQLNKLREE